MAEAGAIVAQAPPTPPQGSVASRDTEIPHAPHIFVDWCPKRERYMVTHMLTTESVALPVGNSVKIQDCGMLSVICLTDESGEQYLPVDALLSRKAYRRDDRICIKDQKGKFLYLLDDVAREFEEKAVNMHVAHLGVNCAWQCFFTRGFNLFT